MAESSADVDPVAYWGYLFHPNKCPTDKLDRLLKGIAACISRDLSPYDSADLKPAQLATFYRRVGGQYDPLFLDMPAQSIAYIYKSLGCLHSLQPDSSLDNSPYASPSIPALKPTGFVTWQTIQLLLGPEEHVPFIQNALKEFDVRDPTDNKPFPTVLPREAFPLKPDQEMVKWHESVSERLRQEAQKENEMGANLDVGKQAREHHRPTSGHVPPGNSTLALKHNSDNRAHAESYFANPFNKNKEGTPGVVRSFTRAPQRVMRGGRNVALTAGRTLKNVVDPHLWSGGGDSHKDYDRESRERARDRRRKSTGDSDYRSVSPLPDRDLSRRHNVARVPPGSRSPDRNGDRYSRSLRDDRKYPSRPNLARPQPREGRPVRKPRSGSSGSSPDAPNERRPRHYVAASPRVSHPSVRRHRSQDPPASPRDYFDDWQRAKPQQHQGGSGGPHPHAVGGQTRPQSNSQYPPMRHPHPPEIRHTEPSFDDDGGSESTDSADLDDGNARKPNAPYNYNPHFHPSASPPMAAKVSHSRGPSGSGLHSQDAYSSQASPSEYRPIDERIGGLHFAPSNTFPTSKGHRSSPHEPRAHLADDMPPSPSAVAADPHLHRRDSAPAISPGAQVPQDGEQYESTHSREGSRYRTASGPGPLLYGEVPLPTDMGAASGGNAGASPMRSPGNRPRRVTPVEGVKGRRYAHDISWPGGRAQG